MIDTWINLLSSSDKEVSDPVIEAMAGNLQEQLAIVEATPATRFSYLQKRYEKRRAQEEKLRQAFAKKRVEKKANAEKQSVQTQTLAAPVFMRGGNPAASPAATQTKSSAGGLSEEQKAKILANARARAMAKHGKTAVVR